MSRLVRELLEALVLALFVFFVVSGSLQNFRVVGASMTETLSEGQYLVVNKLAYSHFDMGRLAQLAPFWSNDGPEEVFTFDSPGRGDVVVFHPPREPDRDFVKRVVGLPGELLEIRSGRVYIDGNPIDEPYVVREFASETRRFARLQQDEYFVMGDNRSGSEDSRVWGSITLDSIVGEVWFIYWPFSELGLVPQPD